MKPTRLLIAMLLPLSLCGCLEVEQHPRWIHGEYNGKPDNLPSQAHFHSDRMAWMAAIENRNHLQNEFLRANP